MDRWPEGGMCSEDFWSFPVGPGGEWTHSGPVSEQRLAALRAMPYGEYLESPEWLGTRKVALMHAKHRCERCGRHLPPLDVHHRTYVRLGCEPLEDLEVLCRACHREEHYG